MPAIHEDVLPGVGVGRRFQARSHKRFNYHRARRSEGNIVFSTATAIDREIQNITSAIATIKSTLL